jgi:KDO2-lipid IV(A) lauroyltransferase
VSYFLFKFISSVLSMLPLSVLSIFAHFLAFLSFSLFRVRRRIILKNLERALGESHTVSERERIGYRSVYHFAMTILELLAAGNGRLAEQCQFVDQHNLDRALAKGRGVYVLCIHIGNWEAMGSAMSRRIRPTWVIVKKVGGPGLDRLVTELRQRNGFQPMVRRRRGDAYRGILEALSRGEIIGFAFDQARPGERELPLFGVPAQTNTSLAAIHLRHPAPILAAYAHRIAPGQHRIEFLPELDTLPLLDNDRETIDARTLLFNKVIEDIIRKHPEQYFWMHNRWKD